MNGVKQRCDFCKEVAVYDAKTKMGPWGFLCQCHFDTYAVGIVGTYTELEPMKLAEKACSRCGKTLPVEMFYEFTDAFGKKRWRAECKECNKLDRKLNSIHKK